MAEIYPLNIDDIVEVRLFLEQQGISKANANRILIITDEPNKSRKMELRAVNINMILEEYSSSSNVATIAKSIYGQTTGVRDGGGDVLVLTTAYMKRDKNVTNFTLPMPSDDTLASIKDFHIAWKIDDGDVQESRLPVDLDVWESLRDAKDRERMFLAALNKLFGSDFKVFKDDVILVFQKHDSSIVDKIEFVHPEGLKVSTLRDLQISLKGFKNGSFYNKVMSISVKKYEFNCLEEYKTFISLIPNEIEKLQKQKTIVGSLTKDESIIGLWDEVIEDLKKCEDNIIKVKEHIEKNIKEANDLIEGLLSIKDADETLANINKIKTISELNRDEIEKVEDFFNSVLKDSYTLLNMILSLYECDSVKDYKKISKNCGFTESPKYQDVLDYFDTIYGYLSDIKEAYITLEHDLNFIIGYIKGINTILDQTEWRLILNELSNITLLSDHLTDLKDAAESILKYEYDKDTIKNKLFKVWKDLQNDMRKPVLEKVDEFIEVYTTKVADKFPKLTTYERYKRRVYGTQEAMDKINTNPLYYNKVKMLILNNSSDSSLDKEATSIMNKEKTKAEITEFLIKVMNTLPNKPKDDDIKKDADKIATEVFKTLYRSEAYDFLLKVGDVIKEGQCDMGKLKGIFTKTKAKCKETVNLYLQRFLDRDINLSQNDIIEWSKDLIKCIDDGKSIAVVLDNWSKRLKLLLWDGWIKENICPNPIRLKKERGTNWGNALRIANNSAGNTNSEEVMSKALLLYFPKDTSKYKDLVDTSKQIAKKELQKNNVYQWFLKACPVVDVYTIDDYVSEATEYTDLVDGYHKPDDPTPKELAFIRFKKWLEDLKAAVDSNDNAAVKAVFMQYKGDIAKNEQHAYEGYVDGLLKKEYDSTYFSNAFKSYMRQFGMDNSDDENTRRMNMVNDIIKKYYKDTEA